MRAWILGGSIDGAVSFLVVWFAAAIGLAAVVADVRAADPDEPHPHQGTLEKYETLPEIVLTPDDEKRLAKGKVVVMALPDDEDSGRGVAIIDIAAPPDTVWSRITGFANYVEWIGPVKECEVYAREDGRICTRTKVAGFLYKFEYFLENHFRPEDSLMFWALDYDRKSDFDDCVGVWYVEPHPAKDGWSRAWFSSDLALRNPLPKFIMNYVKKKGLRDATSWVKRESEKAMADPDDDPGPAEPEDSEY